MAKIILQNNSRGQHTFHLAGGYEKDSKGFTQFIGKKVTFVFGENALEEEVYEHLLRSKYIRNGVEVLRYPRFKAMLDKTRDGFQRKDYADEPLKRKYKNKQQEDKE